MKKTLLFSLLLSFIAAQTCFAAAILDSTIIVNIPGVVNVRALEGVKTNALINPFNGSNDGLEAAFNITTNGGDDIYDFVFTSKIDTLQGAKSGYIIQGDELYLMLANKDYLPDSNSINAIISNPKESANIIAYRVTKNLDFNFQNYNNEPSIKYLIRDRNDVNVHQILSSSPLVDTYCVNNDRTGTYEATIVLNVYRKP